MWLWGRFLLRGLHYNADSQKERWQTVDLTELVDDRNLKKHLFEEALKELTTHHQVLLLAIKRMGISFGSSHSTQDKPSLTL